MQVNKEYLAGFFDGEGCIHLGVTTASGTNNKYPSLIVSLAQSGENGKQLLLNIQAEYGGSLSMNKKLKPSHKDGYQLRWRGSKGILFLNKIKDSLIIKKQKALDVCSFMEKYNAN